MQGYLQIPDETGKFITAMFGLMNAPFCFMKAMYRVLEPLHEQVVLYSLDDVLSPAIRGSS